MTDLKIVNMHEAKTHLSRLVEEALAGHPFAIARAGKPLVKVEALVPQVPRRTGFLKDQIDLPADFDRMRAGEIAAAFEGQEGGR